MNIDRVEGRRDVRWALWVSDEEFHDLHHALRMLERSWLPPRGDEARRIKNAADTLWDAHCRRNEVQVRS